LRTYVLRRVLQAIPLLLGVSILTFVIIDLMPGGVMGAYGAQAGTGADLARIQEQLGLNRPLHEQYLAWLSRFVVGDWGRTLVSKQPVQQLIFEALPNTILLISVSLGIGLVLGLLFGILSAIKQYSILDMVITTFSFAGLSTPIFFSGLLLILIFSVQLGWLPGGGMYTVGQPYSLEDRVRHLILPVAAIAFPLAGEYTRYIRASLLEVLHQDYMRTGYAKGLHPRTVILRHGLRNALVPLVTILGLQLPWMIGGFVVAESIFSWPGMGRLLWQGAQERDYPLMMSVTMLVAAAVLFFNLIADLVYGFVDPRISYE
jgi:peptide/nickel transport system permease protein